MSDFEKEFADKLEKTRRWPGFSYIASQLLLLNRPVNILEIGCMRDPDNWNGDGCSTALWNWFSLKLGGHSTSIDNDIHATVVAQKRCANVRVVCDESVHYLTRHPFEVSELDLLYLDGMDHFLSESYSELQTMTEFCVTYPRLLSGCMIAIDDCHSDESGKHFLVKKFFDRAKTAPIHSSYITVWRKP